MVSKKGGAVQSFIKGAFFTLYTSNVLSFSVHWIFPFAMYIHSFCRSLYSGIRYSIYLVEDFSHNSYLFPLFCSVLLFSLYGVKISPYEEINVYNSGTNPIVGTIFCLQKRVNH